MEKLTFFVDPAWRLSAPHTPLLYPFWGNALDAHKTPFQHALFARHSFDTAYYGITAELRNADAVLMPYSHNTALRVAPQLLAACAAAAQAAKIPLVVDGIGDIEHPVKSAHTLVIRYGGYRFLRAPNEIIIPPYADDLLEIYCGGRVQLREKSPQPSVGFAGWASLSPAQEARAILKELPARARSLFDRRYAAMKKGVFFRRQAVQILEKSTLVKTDFLVRTSYSGHSDTAQKSQELLRSEFVDNMLRNDYVLDVRGDANASTRLFEALSLGRIPVIVDTQRNFPFAEDLDYRTFSFVIDFQELKSLPEALAQFHAALSAEEFTQMQQNARDAYRNFFRVDALTKPLMEEIRRRIVSL